MIRRFPPAAAVQAALAAASGALFLLTVVWRDWIELVFGFDPDSGDGSLEMLLATALLAAAVTSTFLTVRSVRIARAQVPTTNIR